MLTDDEAQAAGSAGFPRRTNNTWGSIYRKWLQKGHDHGSAAEYANEWLRQQAREPEVSHAQRS